MAITNGYTTLADFKARYGVDGTDATRDAQIEAVIQLASRLIDDDCHRVFYATAANTARTFTASNPYRVFIDDLITLDSGGLKTDADDDGTYEVTWATTDYATMPRNASPITWITLSSHSTLNFPCQFDGVQITGTWGYATAAPDKIAEACLIMSYRLWVRKGAPFGIAGGGDTGQSIVLPNDHDYAGLIASFYRA